MKRTGVAQTLKKKAFQHHLNAKKLLRKRVHVLFSAPILSTRRFCLRVTSH
jgi:hypothetical protein